MLPQIPPFSIHLGNRKPVIGDKTDRPTPLFNFPRPNFQFGNERPQQNQFEEFTQPPSEIKPQPQTFENKDKRPKPFQLVNKRKKPGQSQTSRTVIQNIETTTTKVKQTNKPEVTTPEPEKTTENNQLINLDQRIDLIFSEFHKKNKTQTNLNYDTIIFPNEEKSTESTKVIYDETTSLSPIELLSTTPAWYSSTQKRIIPGLPSPDEDGDYNEDDKIGQNALLSLVG